MVPRVRISSMTRHQTVQIGTFIKVSCITLGKGHYYSTTETLIKLVICIWVYFGLLIPTAFVVIEFYVLSLGSNFGFYLNFGFSLGSDWFVCEWV